VTCLTGLATIFRKRYAAFPNEPPDDAHGRWEKESGEAKKPERRVSSNGSEQFTF